MQIDDDRIDEAVLALLHLTTFRHGKNGPWRAWKGHDWDALNRLFDKGLVLDPKGKAKSVVLTEEGRERSQELFEEMFAKSSAELLPAWPCALRESRVGAPVRQPSARHDSAESSPPTRTDRRRRCSPPAGHAAAFMG